MPTREERRKNRKHVLDALHDETGSSGGDAAAERVDRYRADPQGASTEEFSFVGALTLTRFYIDPAKPNNSERRGLWRSIMNRMGKEAADPGGWNGSTSVSRLQAIAEEA